MTNSKPKIRKKDPNVYPHGWDANRTKAIADYYDSRKGEVFLDGTAASREAARLVWMEVPQELVAEIRDLIARGKKSA